TDVKPALGTEIVVGRTPAVVVRHFQGGIAGQFRQPLAAGLLDEAIRL
ncbi:MAG: PilZ domain-containing protein, partial [Methylocystis sp.]|nr:PilZ domain-containing protein [Methylocystis sp.]